MQPTVRMIVTAEHQYAGRRLKPETEYDCEPQHVATMERLGWARRKDGAPEGDPHAYETRDLVGNAGRSPRVRRK